MRNPMLAVLVAAMLAAGTAWADAIRVEPVHFPAGKTGTTIRETVVGRDSISYTLGAEAGQTMTVSLKSSNLATYFNVYEPGRGPGDEALAVGSRTGPMMPDINRFKAKLTSSGTYTISVYLYRAAARRKERSSFTLAISVSALGASQIQRPVKGDYADGLQGGPDYWEVATKVGGGHLAIRSMPSGEAPRRVALLDGTVVRNMGCRMNEGRRWCHVATLDTPSVDGWAAGAFLHESGYAAEQ